MSAERKKQSGSGGSAQVGIVMGSDSDMGVMQSAADVLKEFGVAFEITVASAHRSPQRAAAWAANAPERGIKVIIAGAGHAAHLAGAMAAHTSLPIIGVPIDSSCLQGWDSLLSTVQMPPGIPVATVSIGKSGAKNAGILAAQILALDDSEIARLNKQYLGRSGPTNVIAFPMQQGQFGHINPDLLGDVVISLETTSREANDAGVAIERRFDELLIHGILHLLGFDHDGPPEEAETMVRKEEELLRLL